MITFILTAVVMVFAAVMGALLFLAIGWSPLLGAIVGVGVTMLGMLWMGKGLI